MDLRTVRTELAGHLAAAVPDANVYDHVAAAPAPPAIVVVPDEPYLEPVSIGRDPIRCRVRFRVTVLVGMADNAGSTDRLEALATAVLASLPAGYAVGNVSRPGTVTVGTTEMLVADLAVAVAVSLDRPAHLDPEPEPEQLDEQLDDPDPEQLDEQLDDDPEG